MDLNANMKKRIVEESSTIQQIFQNEQSKIIKKLQDMKFVAEAVPQFYNIQASLYKHKFKTILPVPKSVDDIQLLFLFNYNFYPWIESINRLTF